MTAAKKMTKDDLKKRLAAMKVSAKLKKELEQNEPKEKPTPKSAKVLDLKSKLKKKAVKKEASLFTNPKEQQKYERYGIEAVVVNDPSLGEQVAEVRVDGDLVQLTVTDRAQALAVARGLYEHIKLQAEKLAKALAED